MRLSVDCVANVEVEECYRTVEIRDLHSLNRYADTWNAIARSLDWPFAELRWVLTAAKYLEEDRESFVVAVLRNELLAGALLVTEGTETHKRFLRPTGFGALAESTVLAADGEESELRLIEHMVRRRIPFVLPRMIRSHNLEKSLEHTCRYRGLLLERSSSGSPSLDFRGGMDRIRRSLSANRRNSLRRKLKKLHALGAVEFEFAFPSAEEISSKLDLFANLEDTGWKGKNGSSVRRRRGFYDFFTDSLRAFAVDGQVRFDSMKLDGRVVAIQMGLVWHGRYYLIKPTYDEALASSSPGQLLTYAAIEHSVEEGLMSYEFLGSEDDWKLGWADSIRDTRTWVYYPYNFCGLSTLAKDAGRKLFP